MIKKYTDYWEFIQDVNNIKNAIVLVPQHFKNRMAQMSTANYKALMKVLKENNIKVMEMKNNAKRHFKAK
jgi:hypothetical protein